MFYSSKCLLLFHHNNKILVFFSAIFDEEFQPPVMIFCTGKKENAIYLVSPEPLSEYAPGRIRIITSGEGEKLPESRDREDVISYPLT